MDSRSKAIIDALLGVNWIKTLWFNFHYFKPSVAVRFPVFIYKRTVMKRMDGEIILQGRVHTGMLRIGMPIVGSQDHYFTRTVWQMGGGANYQ